MATDLYEEKNTDLCISIFFCQRSFNVKDNRSFYNDKQKYPPIELSLFENKMHILWFSKTAVFHDLFRNKLSLFTEILFK